MLLVGLQPTIWSGLQRQSRHRHVSSLTLLIQRRLPKPEAQNLKLTSWCRTKLSAQDWRHPAGEILGMVPGTNRPGSRLDSSTGSQYQQRAGKPRANGPSGLTAWLAGQICYRTRFIFPDPHKQKCWDRSLQQKEGLFEGNRGRRRRNKSQTRLPSRKGCGYLWDNQ